MQREHGRGEPRSGCGHETLHVSADEQEQRVAFDTLGLQTYLTAGPKESRAWTIHKGDTAPVAAGVIHTDFQKGFIKAEVISFDDLVAAGSVAEARAKGKARMEGKDYVTGSFSIADAALFYTEFWADRLKMDLPPNCRAHFRRMVERPAVRQVLREEGYRV